MAKKTITTGRASVTMDKDMTAFFLGPLKKIDPNGDIVVYLKNTASYSWAIKYGKDPKTKTGERIIEPQGKRAAQELLIKPMRKSSKVIVNALAKDLFKR